MQIASEFFEYPPQYAGSDPLLKSSMACLIRWISFGKIVPRCAGSQDPQAAWRAARDPGEDDWLWDMDHARLREPWGDGDPLVRDADAPAVGIPNKYAARHLARTLARLLAGTENAVHQKWIRRADEDGVAALLQQYFEDDREEMAASFSGWYSGATSQYRVVVNDSKLEMTKLIIREGRTSKIVEVPSGGDPFEIHYAVSRHAPKGDREPRPFEVLYALLAHDLDQEARDRLRS